MRRPLLLFCFAESFGILLGYYTGLPVWTAAGAAFVLCALYFGADMLLRAGRGVKALRPAEGPESRDGPSGSAAKALLKGRRSFCFLACLAFFLAGFFTVREKEARVSVLESFGGMPVSCEGRALSCRYGEGASQIYVRLERAGLPGKELEPCSEKVLVKLEEGGIEELFSLPGRRVRLTGTVLKPDGRRNPFGFDYRLYLKGRGVLSVLSPNPFRFEKGEVVNIPLNLVSVLKGGFLERARELLDKRSFGLVSGLMFGEKGFMDWDEAESFRHNGIAHVLAVSGLHVGLLYAVIMKLLGGRRDLKAGLVTLAALFFYAALADFSISVMRAGLMISLNILAFRLRRRYDMVSAASLTALVFLSTDPYQLFDSGFQLSFTAAYSLGVVLPWISSRVVEISDERKSDLIYYAGNLAGPCLAVQLGMLPLTLFHFLCFSPLSFFVNPAAIALAALILPSGLAMLAFFMAERAFEGLNLGFAALFGKLLCAGASGPARSFASVLGGLSDISERAGEALFGGFDAPAPPINLICLYYALFFWFFSETRYVLRRRRKNGALCLVLAVLCSFSCLLPKAIGVSESVIPWSYGRALVSFLDVGQGDCVHLNSGSFDLLVDGGGSLSYDIADRILVPTLLKQGIRSVDLCIVTHLDSDHSLGLAQLSKRMKVGCFAFSAVYEGDPALEDFRSDRKIFLSAGDELVLTEDLSLKVLSPALGSARSGDDNENCLVLMAENRGIKLLLAADAGFEQEDALLAAFKNGELEADALKAGHHGSASSTGEAFLGAVSPSFCAISCGRNNSYGHPSQRVIDLLEKSSIIYGRTDADGALVLRVKNGAIWAENAAKDRKWQIR